MIYRDFGGIRLSQLGFGMMRLPVSDNTESGIDEKQVSEMVDYAISHGVNYFDTAWGYHDGNSELVAGRCLNKHPRESVYLATKFPGYDTSNFGKAEEIFEEQLKKCGVEYFDFYLLHNVYEKNADYYLDDETYRTISYFLQQKKNGRIRHLGFSAHGAIDNFKYFLEKFGKELEFCQLQINYLDWNFQDAKEKVELLNKYNIPVWVMEPLRGGKLCSLSAEDTALIGALRPDESVTSWAFRFLQTVKGVTVILSGMSDFSQMKENIKTFEEDKPLNETEFETIVGIADKMVKSGILPCTGCRYCTSYCPKEIDIPRVLSLYNEHTFSGGGFLAPMGIMAMPDGKRPNDCIGCKSCENVCPQQIGISEVMKEFSKTLGL